VVQILPSIFAADFIRLGEDVRRVEGAGVKMLHVDIMDGHFVPNFTMGTPITEALRRFTKLKLDHHLMIEDPDRYIPDFAEAGANWISVHQEACRHLHRTLQLIHSHGCKPGVVINPATPVEMIGEVLEMVNLVLVMTVNPGFGAQEFIPATMHKVRRLAEIRKERRLNFRIEVDGGIALDTVAEAVRAGAEVLVAGT